jgi:hypothetical protein
MSRHNDYDILDEYVDVTNKIKEIQGILNRYREDTRIRLDKTDTEEKKEELVLKFQKKMRQIKKSDLITSRYRKLKKRQAEIRAMLLPDDSDSNSDSNSDYSDSDDNVRSREDILSLLENIKSNITQ